MQPETITALVLLGPPATFGVLVIIDDAIADARAARRRRQSHPRHPSTLPLEDRPDWPGGRP